MHGQPYQNLLSPPLMIPAIANEITQFLVEFAQRVNPAGKCDQLPVDPKIVPVQQRNKGCQEDGVPVQALPKDMMDKLVLAAAVLRAIERL